MVVQQVYTPRRYIVSGLFWQGSCSQYGVERRFPININRIFVSTKIHRHDYRLCANHGANSATESTKKIVIKRLFQNKVDVHEISAFNPNIREPESMPSGIQKLHGCYQCSNAVFA